MISRSRVRSDAASSAYATPSTTTTLTMKRTKYQSARRDPNVRVSRSRHFEDIAHAPRRMQQRRIEPAIDLLAQPEHGHVHDVAARIEVVTPHVRQDHRLRH